MTASVEAKSAGAPIAAVKAALAAKPDGVLESLAEAHELPYRAVLDCLATEQRRAAYASHFETVWQDLTTWGPACS